MPQGRQQKMSGSNGLKNALELITVAALCALFIFNVWDHFTKYVNGETTNFVRTTEETGVGFPAVMLCPHRGYKFDRLRRLNVSADHWYLDNSWNNLDSHSKDSWADASIESMEELYKDTTFSAGEIIREIMYYDGRTREQVLLYDGETNLDPSMLSMRSIRSLSHGQCVAIQLIDQVTNDLDGLRVQTRDDAGDINLIVAEVSDVELFLGASLDVWNQGETRTLVAANTYLQVGMAKKVQQLLPDTLRCTHDEKGEGTLRSSCIMDGMSEYLAKNADVMCYLPHMGNWTRGFSACRDRAAAMGTFYILQAGIWELYTNRTCPESCRVVNYHLKERARVLSGKIGAGSSYLMLYFDTIQVEQSQQKPLYDGTSFTAAVGGAMGLFLGFSFLDFGRKFIKWLVKMVGDEKKDEAKINDPY